MFGEMNPRNPIPPAGAAFAEMRLSANTARAGGFSTAAIPWNVVAKDTQGLWEPATSSFRIRKSGVYMVSLTVLMTSQTAAYICVFLNNALTRAFLGSDDTEAFKNICSPLYLSAGDMLYATLESSSASTMRSDISTFRIAGPF